MAASVVNREGLDTLMQDLRDDGFSLIGPRVRDGSIVYDEITNTTDLPLGWVDEQEGGTYRIAHSDSQTLFAYNLGPTSWKRFLFPPEADLLTIRRSNGGMVFEPSQHAAQRHAFFGARSCELAAIAIQDKVFLGSGFIEPDYSRRRESVFVVAVNCGTAAATCFCASMSTGPQCSEGYDVVLTEMVDSETPEYLLESGTTRGEALIDRLGGRPATTKHYARLRAVVAKTEEAMVRHLDTDGLRDLLVENPGHPRWQMVADRCLTCGNCTLACPTCFCSTTVDTVTLDGEATRTRRWDSCFSLEFTNLHGHPVRGSSKSRYRQWMTHKLATWQDQFGTSGCVGCGRCITWCPVGIDITEEVAAMRETVTI